MNQCYNTTINILLIFFLLNPTPGKRRLRVKTDTMPDNGAGFAEASY